MGVALVGEGGGALPSSGSRKRARTGTDVPMSESSHDKTRPASTLNPALSSPLSSPSLRDGSIEGMEQWLELGTPTAVVRALRELGFVTPTAIQRRAIPAAMRRCCDIIGAAETVSGVEGVIVINLPWGGGEDGPFHNSCTML